MTPRLRKLTLNITPDTVEALDAVLQGGETQTEVINRAIRLYRLIRASLRSGGAVYVQETPGGDLKQLFLL